jgi:hypothetical protein
MSRLSFGLYFPESFERQLGDRVTKRLKSPARALRLEALQAPEVFVGNDAA